MCWVIALVIAFLSFLSSAHCEGINRHVARANNDMECQLYGDDNQVDYFSVMQAAFCRFSDFAHGRAMARVATYLFCYRTRSTWSSFFNVLPIDQAASRDLQPLWPRSSGNLQSNAEECLARTNHTYTGMRR